MKNTQKGFAPIIILIVVALVGGGSYYYYQNNINKQDDVDARVENNQISNNSSETKQEPISKATDNYSVHRSSAGFELKYPKSWEVAEINLKDPKHKGSVNIFPTDGLINKDAATGAYGTIIKNLNTQSFTALVESSKPGQEIPQESLAQELYKESQDIISEEIMFSQPGSGSKITKTEKTDSTVLISYEYTFNNTLFKGTQRSVIHYNSKDKIYNVVMMHYRAKADIYNQDIADTLLNSIKFN